ncbi:hypothetical protein CAEBREN_03159 [Caenorhabditis brenneri]|uniref:Uncharacterized protein n=1 Tax=Caenorhabditis brenneri TaxID=135651 RepID=G0NIB0_CAEBE|nr:hypothetical protein CAEBREN_03159 [Caenorhabditis brenneri]
MVFGHRNHFVFHSKVFFVFRFFLRPSDETWLLWFDGSGKPSAFRSSNRLDDFEDLHWNGFNFGIRTAEFFTWK